MKFRIKWLLCIAAVLFSCSCNKSEMPTNVDSVEVGTSLASDENEKKDITIVMAYRGATLYRANGEDLVDTFNREDNGYKIELRNYGSDYDPYHNPDNEWTNGDQQLCLDIMNGEIDIIPNDFCDKAKFHSLAEKGAFSDLYKFIDNDPEFDRSDFIEHVLDVSAIDNKLFFLPLSFKLKTLIGKTKYVGEKENWTLDELKEHWAKMPDGYTFNGSIARNNVYYTILRGSLSSFIDFDKGTCNFDSDEFVDILEFINTFEPSPRVKPDNMDYEHIFVTDIYITGFQSFHNLLIEHGNDSTTFVGYPSQNGNGTFIDSSEQQIAVSALSSKEKQQGAWEFVKLLASHDNQVTMMYPESYTENGTKYSFGDVDHCFPINKNVFEELANEQLKKQNENNFINTSVDSVDYGHLDDDEYSMLLNIIDSAKGESTVIDEDIKEIIDEELLAMFADEITPQKAAKNIQNRVSIMVSERY